jgi:hypothetical protein
MCVCVCVFQAPLVFSARAVVLLSLFYRLLNLASAPSLIPLFLFVVVVTDIPSPSFRLVSAVLE